MAGENTNASFSPEQLESLNAMMGQTVNNILTARLKTTEKQLLDKATAAIGEAFKTQLPEIIKELRPTPATTDPDPDPKGGKPGKGGRAEDAVEMATLRKMIDDLKKSDETSKAKARAAEAKQREMEKTRVVLEELAKLGVTDPFKQELALAHLDRKKRIAWSGEEEDAALLWNEEGRDPVSFREGFESWGKSDEVKHFLPATGIRGSGSGPVREQPNKPGQKPTKDQAFTILGESLKDALSGQF